MKTLIILDLARTEVLDRTAMAAVRGGWKMSMQASSAAPAEPKAQYGLSVDATQHLAQYQDVLNATAMNSAFLDCVDVTNTTSQFGQNNIVVGR